MIVKRPRDVRKRGANGRPFAAIHVVVKDGQSGVVFPSLENVGCPVRGSVVHDEDLLRARYGQGAADCLVDCRRLVVHRHDHRQRGRPLAGRRRPRRRRGRRGPFLFPRNCLCRFQHRFIPQLVTVHGATVILSAAKDLGRVNARARSFAALRMTGTLPRYERLPQLQGLLVAAAHSWRKLEHRRSSVPVPSRKAGSADNSGNRNPRPQRRASNYGLSSHRHGAYMTTRPTAAATASGRRVAPDANSSGKNNTTPKRQTRRRSVHFPAQTVPKHPPISRTSEHGPNQIATSFKNAKTSSRP